MNYYNCETLLEQQAEIEKLKSERNALAAQVEALKQIAYLADGARVEAADDNGGEEKRWLHKLYCAVGEYDCTATPAACLAQVRADAGRAGFIAGARALETIQILASDESIFELADDYAERIRQGGAS